MKPWENPWRKRGQARFQKSMVEVSCVMKKRATAASEQPPASMRRWSMRDTRRPEIMSAIIVPSPPGARVSPAVHASYPRTVCV